MDEKLNYLGISIDDYSKECAIDNESVHLPRMQYKLLSYLLHNKGKRVSFQEIKDNVWKRDATKRCIVVTMSKLKDNIKPYDKCIDTYYGFGYKLGEHD